jgi:hypothetical protein
MNKTHTYLYICEHAHLHSIVVHGIVAVAEYVVPAHRALDKAKLYIYVCLCECCVYGYISCLGQWCEW